MECGDKMTNEEMLEKIKQYCRSVVSCAECKVREEECDINFNPHDDIKETYEAIFGDGELS